LEKVLKVTKNAFVGEKVAEVVYSGDSETDADK